MAEEKLDKHMEWLNFCKDARTTIEQERFLNQMFIEQDAYISEKTGKMSTKAPNKVSRKIAKARKMLRDIRNTITKNDPRWNTDNVYYEGEYSEEDIYVSNLYLKEIFRRRFIKTKIKDLLYNSIMKSVGFREIFYDADGLVNIKNIDTFDIYIDKYAEVEGPIIKARRIIKAYPMTVESVKEKYGIEVKPDNKEAESDRKQSILTQENPSPTKSSFGTVMCYDHYIKEDKTIKIETYIKGHGVIDTKNLDMEEFPIIIYQPERMGGKLYPTPRIKPTIELNRAYNKIFSSMEERVNAVAKGRRMVPNGAKVSYQSGQNGQITYYEQGKMPTYQQPPSPGEAPFALMGQTEKHIEDTGGIHSESSGSISSPSIRSGVQIGQIQAGDIQNVSEAVDNLEAFLSYAGQIILDIASKNTSTILKIYNKGKEVQLVGKDGASTMEKLTGENKDVKKIKPFSNIKVTIIPGSAYSDGQTKQDVFDLVKMGVQIDPETILDTFNIGNTREILQKMKVEQSKNQNPDVEIANGENKKMMLGQRVMANQTDDHRMHMAIHSKLLQSTKENQQIAQMIMAHMKEHESFAGGIQNQQPTQQPQNV